MTKVSIQKCAYNASVPEITEAIRELLKPLGGMGAFVSAGQKVMLKPNIWGPVPKENATTTDPAVVEAVINLVKELNPGEIWVAEGSCIGADTEEAFDVAGYRYLENIEGVQLIDVKKEKVVSCKVPNPQIMDEFQVYERIFKADVVINIAKIKVASSIPVTLSIKNMKGMLADPYKKRCHYTLIDKSIVDFTQILPCDLCIVDGLVGSSYYDTVNHGILIAGTDRLAVDTVIVKCVGGNPEDVGYMKNAAEIGLGTWNLDEIEVCGVSIEEAKHDYRFTKNNIEAYKMLYPEAEVSSGNPCTGCTNLVDEVLSQGQREGWLEKWRDKLVVALGRDAKLDYPDKTVLCIGNCLKKRCEGPIVLGCPPIPMEITDWLIENAPKE